MTREIASGRLTLGKNEKARNNPKQAPLRTPLLELLAASHLTKGLAFYESKGYSTSAVARSHDETPGCMTGPEMKTV